MNAPQVKAGNHYRSVAIARRDGWPDKLDGGVLDLDQYNHLGDIAKSLISADRTRDLGDVLQTTLNAFRYQYERNGKGWQILPWLQVGDIRVQNRRAPQPVIESTHR